MLKKIAAFAVIVLAIGAMTLVMPAGAAEEKAAAPAVKAAEPAKPATALKEGDAVVDFELADISGKPVKFSSLLGKKATILVFAQSACSACRAEADQVISIAGKKKEVSVVYVMVDLAGPAGAKSFLEQFKVNENGKALFDKEFSVGPRYGVFSTPAALVIKDGKVEKRFPGFDPNDNSLAKYLSSL